MIRSDNEHGTRQLTTGTSAEPTGPCVAELFLVLPVVDRQPRYADQLAEIGSRQPQLLSLGT